MSTHRDAEFGVATDAATCQEGTSLHHHQSEHDECSTIRNASHLPTHEDYTRDSSASREATSYDFEVWPADDDFASHARGCAYDCIGSLS